MCCAGGAGAPSAVQQEVDAFLLQLPLGTGSEDAVIEEAVGAKLVQALSCRAALQQKLADWWVMPAA